MLSSITHRVRTLLIGALALLAGLDFGRDVFAPSLSDVTHGFPVYYVSARLIVEGRWSERIYDDDWFGAQVRAMTNGRRSEVYSANPPTTSLLLLPIAWLDMPAARATWLVVNLVLLIGSLVLLLNTLVRVGLNEPIVVTLSEAKSLSAMGGMLRSAQHDTGWGYLGRTVLGRPRDFTFGAGMLAFTFAYAPLREDFHLAQAYTFLLFLLTLTFWGFVRTRSVATGITLGTALATKLSGGLLWLLLALRGRWREIAIGIGVGLGFVLLSLALTGWAGWAKYFSLLPDHIVGRTWPPVLAFQSSPNFFQHLLAGDAAWPIEPIVYAPSLAVLLSAAVSGTALVLTLRRARRANFDIAFATMLTLGVILLPFAEEYHYTLLLLPLTVMASRIARAPIRRLDVIWLAATLFLLAAPLPYASQDGPGWSALLGYPRLYGGWLAWGWLYAQK